MAPQVPCPSLFLDAKRRARARFAVKAYQSLSKVNKSSFNKDVKMKRKKGEHSYLIMVMYRPRPQILLIPDLSPMTLESTTYNSYPQQPVTNEYNNLYNKIYNPTSYIQASGKDYGLMLAGINVSQVLSQRSTEYISLRPELKHSYHLYTTSSQIHNR